MCHIVAGLCISQQCWAGISCLFSLAERLGNLANLGFIRFITDMSILIILFLLFIAIEVNFFDLLPLGIRDIPMIFVLHVFLPNVPVNILPALVTFKFYEVLASLCWSRTAIMCQNPQVRNVVYKNNRNPPARS